MTNLSRLAAAVAVVVSVLPGAVADAQPGGRLEILRMDGYVGPPPKGRRERADLLMRTGEKDVRFQVTSATVTSGKIKPSAIFNRVRPYNPNFLLRGPKELLDQVADAPPGARLRIVGGSRAGSRDFLLSSVEAQPSGDRPAAP